MPSARGRTDETLKAEISRIYNENFEVYGARKIWQELHRQGFDVARCTVERLMGQMGLQGVRRAKKKRTTTPAEAALCPSDLVDRKFQAARPNGLWVADITYVRLPGRFCYVAFVIDVFSRRIVGWALATHLRTDLVLDTLEMAIWNRDQHLDGLVHHSDRGSQYVSIRYTERLAALGISSSVGSRGDSYDNALAESAIGLYKAELIDHRGPWPNAESVELATLAWVDWYNTARLHSACDHIPPAEFEDAYYRRAGPPLVVGSQ